jgi:hypothetical protein
VGALPRWGVRSRGRTGRHPFRPSMGS